MAKAVTTSPETHCQQLQPFCQRFATVTDENVAMMIIIMFIHTDEADEDYDESRDVPSSNNEDKCRPTSKIFSTKGVFVFVIHVADVINQILVAIVRLS